MRLGFPREWEATPRYSVLSSTPWSPKRWTGEPMAPSGSCSGIEGTGWGWTCLLKPLLRHFFLGGANLFVLFPGGEGRRILGTKLPSFHNVDTSANCRSDSHSPSTARGCESWVRCTRVFLETPRLLHLPHQPVLSYTTHLA